MRARARGGSRRRRLRVGTFAPHGAPLLVDVVPARQEAPVDGVSAQRFNLSARTRARGASRVSPCHTRFDLLIILPRGVQIRGLLEHYPRA